MAARRLPRSLLLAALYCASAAAAVPDASDVARRVAAIEPQVILWRRDFHQHPELSNREVRTARIVAEQLRSFGLEVRTGVAHTGVIGVLRGARPGRTIALRADMDALPVEEKTVLPFSSRARGEYQGKDVPVMHACGHDAHVAMLLGAAQVLAQLRSQIAGNVVFVFQPAEEGAPEGEQGGAPLILAEKGLADPAPDAIFGIHVWPGTAGHLYYRAGGALAANDTFHIVVAGKQTHGAQPWNGIDPITVGAEIVQGLNAIVARQLDVTRGPSVITVSMFHGGVRTNIIPEQVELAGTLRTLDPQNREEAQRRIVLTATRIAESAGATAAVDIRKGNPVTWNDPALTQATVPSLQRAAGEQNVEAAPLITASEDFAAYEQAIPGVFYLLGINADGVAARDAAPNHSPNFFVNEAALATGVRAHVLVALDYLSR